jgi:hypothetical protein
MQCECGRKPILKGVPTGPELGRGYVIECPCGEVGVNAKTKGGAQYGWIRRRQVREALRWRRSNEGK